MIDAVKLNLSMPTTEKPEPTVPELLALAVGGPKWHLRSPKLQGALHRPYVLPTARATAS